MHVFNSAAGLPFAPANPVDAIQSARVIDGIFILQSRQSQAGMVESPLGANRSFKRSRNIHQPTLKDFL